MTAAAFGIAGSLMDSFSERFEELRAAYRARLAVELGALRVHAQRLASPEAVAGGNATLIEEIRQLAHRMAGAAGMFQAPSIAAAADLLEDAARDDAARHSLTGLRQALDHLMTQIEDFGA